MLFKGIDFAGPVSAAKDEETEELKDNVFEDLSACEMLASRVA